jgi:lysine-N-methylase
VDVPRGGERGVPARPRLAERVAARRHRAGAAEHVVLHDLETGGRVVIGEREWTLLGVADGTRDLAGLLEAARRRGARASTAHLEAFLGQLTAAGLVVEGTGESAEPGSVHEGADGGATSRATDAAPAPSASSPAASSDAASGRLLLPLPGFRLRCDGSGSCCRLYPSVVFTPPEVARARALLPELEDAGMDPARLFTPERGVDRGEPRTWVVAQRDGRCSYLEGDGRCALHVAGGAAAKPLGCRTYPARFVDDGEVVRVAPLVECACVLASAVEGDQDHGDPLVPDDCRVRADLPAGVWVEALRSQIAVSARQSIGRSQWIDWSRAAAARLGGDAAGALWALASELDGGQRELDARAAGAWVEALARRAEARAREDRSWRAPRDLALLSVDWLARGSALLADASRAGGPLPEADARGGRAEAFYVRALLHGHQLPGQLDVASALRDRAVRLLVARAMGGLAMAAPPTDGGAAHDLRSVERWPLALVEATLRAHGLAAYAHDVVAR